MIPKMITDTVALEVTKAANLSVDADTTNIWIARLFFNTSQ